LDSLAHEIKGEVYTFKSMLTYEPDKNNYLLHLLWHCQFRLESFALSCLNNLVAIIVSSPAIMEYFSTLPGVTY